MFVLSSEFDSKDENVNDERKKKKKILLRSNW